MPDADLEEIADEVYVELLEEDAAEREEGDGRGRLQTAQDPEKWLGLAAAVPEAPAAPIIIPHHPDAEAWLEIISACVAKRWKCLMTNSEKCLQGAARQIPSSRQAVSL